MKNNVVEFIADKVRVSTGKADNSAVISFTVGEYQLIAIKELVNVIDKNLRVSIEIMEE